MAKLGLSLSVLLASSSSLVVAGTGGVSLRGAASVVRALQADNNNNNQQQPAPWFNVIGRHDDAKVNGENINLSISPDHDSTQIYSKEAYNKGRVEFKGRSGSVMPGVVTSMYLSSRDETSQASWEANDNDQLSFEFIGKNPNLIQTNVVMHNKDHPQVFDAGFDTSNSDHDYAMEWDEHQARFFVDGKQIRSSDFEQPPKPMYLRSSLWTTIRGWDGVKNWAGVTNWATRNNQPITATWQFLERPGVPKQADASTQPAPPAAATTTTTPTATTPAPPADQQAAPTNNEAAATPATNQDTTPKDNPPTTATTPEAQPATPPTTATTTTNQETAPKDNTPATTTNAQPAATPATPATATTTNQDTPKVDTPPTPPTATTTDTQAPTATTNQADTAPKQDTPPAATTNTQAAPTPTTTTDQQATTTPTANQPAPTTTTAAPTNEQSPWYNVIGRTADVNADGENIKLTISPEHDATQIYSKEAYNKGRWEFKGRSGSVMPGVVTSMYLSSRDETSQAAWDANDNDQMSFEFVGNKPTMIQTNLVIHNKDYHQNFDAGFDHGNSDHDYAMEWDEHQARYYVDGKQIRSTDLEQPLKPMHLRTSLWTTERGWDGVKQWAGTPDWGSRGNSPITTTWQFIERPSTSKQADNNQNEQQPPATDTTQQPTPTNNQAAATPTTNNQPSQRADLPPTEEPKPTEQTPATTNNQQQEPPKVDAPPATTTEKQDPPKVETPPATTPEQQPATPPTEQQTPPSPA